MKKIREEYLNLFQVNGIIQGYLFNVKDKETLKEVHDFYWEFLSPVVNPFINEKTIKYHHAVILLVNAGRSKRMGEKDSLIVLFDDDFNEGVESSALLDTHIIDLDGRPNEKKTIIKTIKRGIREIIYWIQGRYFCILDEAKERYNE